MQPRTLVFALFPYATLFRSPGGGLRLGLAPHRRPAAGHTFGQRRRGARRDLDGGAGGDAGGGGGRGAVDPAGRGRDGPSAAPAVGDAPHPPGSGVTSRRNVAPALRSEEHTSELQSRENLV